MELCEWSQEFRAGCWRGRYVPFEIQMSGQLRVGVVFLGKIDDGDEDECEGE